MSGNGREECGGKAKRRRVSHSHGNIINKLLPPHEHMHTLSQIHTHTHLVNKGLKEKQT